MLVVSGFINDILGSGSEIFFVSTPMNIGTLQKNKKYKMYSCYCTAVHKGLAVSLLQYIISIPKTWPGITALNRWQHMAGEHS